MSKTIIVIRHGESEWNATPRPDREQWYFKQLEAAEQEAHNSKLLGCRLRDARMTAKGKAQCEELRKLLIQLEAVKHLKPEIVVVSPLTRALETASIVFPDSAEVPIKLFPGMQEHVVNICDVGRPVSALQQEFPKLDFSQLQEHWWTVPMSKETPQSLQTRITAFHNYLRSLPQQVIVLVGHGHFLRELLKGTPAESAYMRNTEFRILELPVAEKEYMASMDTAIVVCGLQVQLDGPSLHVLTERVNLAKKLFFDQSTYSTNTTNNNNNNNTNTTSNTNLTNNNTIVIMAGGPTSQQVLTAEGSVMKVLAAKSGIPVDRIFVEDRSMDTIENAVYAKLILEAKFPNIKKIIVVTSDYHQQRALMVFQRVFGENYSFSIHGASSSTSLSQEIRLKNEENEKHFISILDDLFTKFHEAQAKNQGS